MNKKKRILINMEGGLIQHISSNIPDLEIVILDYDLPETEPLEEIDVNQYEPDTFVKGNQFTTEDVFGDLDNLTEAETHFFNQLKQLGW